jgi:hypothetical protein
MTQEIVFSVQDETGTVTQITLDPSPSPSMIISPGDTGGFMGIPDDGTDLEAGAVPNAVTCPFTVIQVLDNEHFSISTMNSNLADWPAGGQITWATGANAGQTSNVFEIDAANAYISEAFYFKYCASRGYTQPAHAATISLVQAAIVQGTDYLDHRYRYKGIKLLQSIGTSVMDANAAFFQSWLTPYAVVGMNYLTPTTTTQSTEWPRQGTVDLNGDTVNGIPKQIQMACAELAFRVLSGTALQPDYDPNLVGNGGVMSSVTKKVGPLETVNTYDTKFGLGFFATFPIVDRLLKPLLHSGGNRSVMR